MNDGRPFTFSVETEISFGKGVRRGVGTAARRFGLRAALVVSGHAFVRSQFRPGIEAALADEAVDIVLVCQSTGEPTLADAAGTGAAVRAAGAELIVAIGGGSTLDLAKAAAVAAVEGVELRSLAGGPRFDTPGLPVVAIPTTAGSGAEVSRGAIVLDEQAGLKRGIRGRGVAPRVALVDPELVTSCPPSVTSQAGFDAVSHAVETALSRAAAPINRLLSLEALGQLLAALPRALEAPDDVDARAAASYAALLMGINLANSTTCLPHRMQYPVGALTRTEHARGVAALMPAWLGRTLKHAPEGLAYLAPAAGKVSGRVDEDAAAVVDAVLGLMAGLHLQPRLSDLGVGRDDLVRLTEMVEGAVENDPGPSDRAAILALYEASY